MNPLKAIREKCIDCCCGNMAEVKRCTAEDCPLWRFRFGTNPDRKKRELTEQQKQAMIARLAEARERNK